MVREGIRGLGLAAALAGVLAAGTPVQAMEWSDPLRGARFESDIASATPAGLFSTPSWQVRPGAGPQPFQGRNSAAGTVTEVAINGLKNIAVETVQAAMKLKVGEEFSDTLLLQDAAAIQGLGLFQNVLPYAEPTPGGVRVVVDLVENPVIEKIRFVGDIVVPEEELRKVMTLQPGRVLNVNALRTDAGNLRRYLDGKGYFSQIESAEFSQSEPGTFEIKIVVMRVAGVRLEGLRATKEKVVRRELRTKPGEFFNLETWRKDILRVYNLGFFDAVDALEPNAPTIDTVELGLKFQERRTGSVNLGVSYADRQSFAGFIQVEEANLFGSGQSAYLKLMRANRAGQVDIDVGYSNPWLDSRRTGMSVNLYDKQVYRFSRNFFGGETDPNATERYDERRSGGVLTFSRPFGEALTAFASGRLEGVRTSDVPTTDEDKFILQDGDVSALTLGAVHNTRDLDIDPASGHYFKSTLETGISNITKVAGAVSGEDVLGRNAFTKFQIDMRWYYSGEGRRLRPDDSRHVWALRLYAGTLVGKIPFFEQYFAGGADSIRGYSEDRFWGNHVAFANLEYRIPIQKGMSAVAFVDYGSAWGGYGTVNTFTQSRTFDGKLGYGIGLHFRTPLGPIRLDLAINEDGKSKTHFMIGHTF
ncbi:MAG: hypothetical protein AMXMBFR61_08670 [Fimbriimonadales bacterium]